MSHLASGATVSALTLRIDERTYGDASRITVAVLVDDQDKFARIGDQEYHGWHPSLILDADTWPLLPLQPARRIGIYPWNTFYIGEGCITAIIEDHGNLIAWRDFRDSDGYKSPLGEPEDEVFPGRRLDVADLFFDSRQYRAEVALVTEDRWWETAELKTARLLKTRLLAEREYLSEVGWRLVFVSRRESGYWVTLRDADGHQAIVNLAEQPGDAAEQAAAMVEFLLVTPPGRWPVGYCGYCYHHPGSESEGIHHPVHGSVSAG